MRWFNWRVFPNHLRKAMKKRFLFASALIAFGIAACTPAPSTIQGRILSTRGEPLANTTVQLENSDVVTTTDEAGNFTLVTPRLPYSLLAFPDDKNITVYRGLSALSPTLQIITNQADSSILTKKTSLEMTPLSSCPIDNNFGAQTLTVFDVQGLVAGNNQSRCQLSSTFTKLFLNVDNTFVREGKGRLGALTQAEDGAFVAYHESIVEIQPDGALKFAQPDAKLVFQNIQSEEFEVVRPDNTELRAALVFGSPENRILFGQFGLDVVGNRVKYPRLPTQIPMFILLNISNNNAQVEKLIPITDSLNGSKLELPSPPKAIGLTPGDNVTVPATQTFTVGGTGTGVKVFSFDFPDVDKEIVIYTDQTSATLPDLKNTVAALEYSGQFAWGVVHLPNIGLEQFAGFAGFGRNMQVGLVPTLDASLVETDRNAGTITP
jgi:hypothetical protein